MAIKRCSVAEWAGSGATRGSERKNASISARVSPCFAHFAVLPVSHSNCIKCMYKCVDGQGVDVERGWGIWVKGGLRIGKSCAGGGIW